MAELIVVMALGAVALAVFGLIGAVLSLVGWVVVLPFRQQIEAADPNRAWQRFVARRCTGSPLRCIDPLETLREHRDRPLFNGRSSYHFNPEGHRLLAEWLDARLPAAGMR